MTAAATARPATTAVETNVGFWSVVWIVAVRGILRMRRMPSLVVQSMFFPTFFLIVYTGLYAAITRLPGFPTDDITNWYVPFMMLQGAAFGGLGAGFATGLDIENGFFDRLLLTPAPRAALMLGTTLYSLIRSLVVAVAVAAVGVVLGASPTDWLGLPLLLLAVVGVSLMGSFYALALMYRVKDQRAAQVLPIGMFLALFASNAQVPLSIATGWVHWVGRINPLSNVLRLARQAFLESGVSWADTWGGLVALGACTAVLAIWAARGLQKFTP